MQQIITTACHHCADPACANGCPVLAYEKDGETGIVRHLDDQCIGCQYCILKCPYDVPKYSPARGIVRKCDMCTSRLAEGEAPACVQACPNDAIRIVTVSRASLFDSTARATTLTPDAFDSSYTRPSTVYTGLHASPALRAADAAALQPQHAHWPLVVMLFLTQCATGFLLAAALLPGHPFALRLAGAAVLAAGVIASTTHLGQPLKAWRAFLGWRKSWLSREILAFGAAVPAAALAVPAPASFSGYACAAAAAASAASVFCSIMVYADTRRALWRFPLTATSMIGCTLTVAGAAAALVPAAGPPAAGLITAVLLLGRTLAVSGFTHRWRDAPPESHAHAKSALLMYGPLKTWWHCRLFAGLAAAALIFHFPAAALLLVLTAEWAERLLFFRAVVAPKMPGTA